MKLSDLRQIKRKLGRELALISLPLIRRHDKSREWSNLRAFSCELRDADGQKILLFDKTGKPQQNDNFLYIFSNNYSDLSKDKAIFEFVGHELEPANGWSSVKEPIALNALVTDETSWLLHICAEVSQQSGDYKTLAAVPADPYKLMHSQRSRSCV